MRIRVDGKIRFEYGYVWTWKFLNPQRKICGFKNIRIRTIRQCLRLKVQKYPDTYNPSVLEIESAVYVRKEK